MYFKFILTTFFVSGVIAGSEMYSRVIAPAGMSSDSPEPPLCSPKADDMDALDRCANHCLEAAVKDNQDLSEDTRFRYLRVVCIGWCIAYSGVEGHLPTAEDVEIWRNGQQGQQWEFAWKAKEKFEAHERARIEQVGDGHAGNEHGHSQDIPF